MITRFFIVLSLVGFSVYANAQGATTVGDGGHGVVCKVGLSYNAEILDLYEARLLYGNAWYAAVPSKILRNFRDNSSTVCKILRARRDQLNRILPMPTDIHQSFERACELTKNIRITSRIPQTTDIGELLVEVPNYCRVVQIGRHFKNDEVWLNRAYSKNLEQIDVLAFLLHESLHGHFTWGDTRAIRQFVMYALADEEFQKLNLDSAKRLLKTRTALPVKAFR